MNAKQWEVFFVPSCRYAKPPKDKFIVVAYINPCPHGFFINSKINKFIRNRPNLLSCEAQILVSQHTFLKYDSYVDCRDLFSFVDSDLTRSRGILSLDAQTAILSAVDACPVLEEHHKIKILDRDE
ncbi:MULTISPECIES: hypothetical protein [Spirulina sp. CCY15215]|uniref:hypothetical protein n=1 Tax=Spirulina sp. CCY15215 TaxID=2767591 RepID=UPI0019503F4B|nr:hypothetical protein [Spirulina major]